MERQENESMDDYMARADRAKRGRTVASLRRLVEFLEQNPEVPTPYIGDRLFIFCYENVELFKRVRSLGGFNAKNADDNDFIMSRDFGEFKLELCVDREKVCHRVQKGTRVVEATPERTVPAQPAREEPIYEWVCPDSILEKLGDAS